MTPRTAAMAISVVRPDISIRPRTRETNWAACGSRVSLVGSVMTDEIEKVAMAAEDAETVTVAAEQSGERLDRVLAGAVALSRTRLKALILDGAVAIGGRTIRHPRPPANARDGINPPGAPARKPGPRGETNSPDAGPEG